MRRCVGLLICLLTMTFGGCSRSNQPTASQPSPPASFQAGVATSGPANQPKIDACALLNSKEIQSIQGETLKEAKTSGRSEGGFAISQCFFTLPTSTNSISLLVAQRGDPPAA